MTLLRVDQTLYCHSSVFSFCTTGRTQCRLSTRLVTATTCLARPSARTTDTRMNGFCSLHRTAHSTRLRLVNTAILPRRMQLCWRKSVRQNAPVCLVCHICVTFLSRTVEAARRSNVCVHFTALTELPSMHCLLETVLRDQQPLRR